MEENNLNKDLHGTMPLNQSSDISNESLHRPVLRKIKRPKIRPMETNTIVPPKIEPQDMNKNIETSFEHNFLHDMHENAKTNNEEVNLISTTEVENEPTYPQSFVDENTSQDSDISTSLITSDVAKEIVNKESPEPFIIEGLPPSPDDEPLDDYDDNEIYMDDYIKKNFAYILVILGLLIGLFIGKTLFSSSIKTIERHGLEGVVTNSDVPAGRPRCGLTDKGQACVFYIMNWYKQELNGRDFYKLAAQLTGREEYMIDTANLRYATVKIKPGNFAQINIPALK